MSREHDPRWHDPERPDPGRGESRARRPSRRAPGDARDVFARDLDLPRGPARERVVHRDRVYTLRGSEVRTLATVGAFRVVPAADLRDAADRPAQAREGTSSASASRASSTPIPLVDAGRAHDPRDAHAARAAPFSNRPVVRSATRAPPDVLRGRR